MLRIFFLFAVLTATSASAADAKLEITTDQAVKTAAPKLKPTTQENVIVYKVNHAPWQWEDGFDLFA